MRSLTREPEAPRHPAGPRAVPARDVSLSRHRFEVDPPAGEAAEEEKQLELLMVATGRRPANVWFGNEAETFLRLWKRAMPRGRRADVDESLGSLVELVEIVWEEINADTRVLTGRHRERWVFNIFETYQRLFLEMTARLRAPAVLAWRRTFATAIVRALDTQAKRVAFRIAFESDVASPLDDVFRAHIARHSVARGREIFRGGIFNNDTNVARYAREADPAQYTHADMKRKIMVRMHRLGSTRDTDRETEETRILDRVNDLYGQTQVALQAWAQEHGAGHGDGEEEKAAHPTPDN